MKGRMPMPIKYPTGGLRPNRPGNHHQRIPSRRDLCRPVTAGVQNPFFPVIAATAVCPVLMHRGISNIYLRRQVRRVIPFNASKSNCLRYSGARIGWRRCRALPHFMGYMPQNRRAKVPFRSSARPVDADRRWLSFDMRPPRRGQR